MIQARVGEVELLFSEMLQRAERNSRGGLKLCSGVIFGQHFFTADTVIGNKSSSEI